MLLWLFAVGIAAGFLVVYLFQWNWQKSACFVIAFGVILHFASRHDYAFLGPHWLSITVHFAAVSVLSFAAGRMTPKQRRA